GEAADLAAKLGLELPTPGLVDAIWRAADLRIDGRKMVVTTHDGTPKTMNSPETHAGQTKKIEAAVQAHGPYRLLAGAFKDVVRHQGKVGLYGWHRLDGTVIQPFF